MNIDHDFVVCPECGSEFQPRVTRCIDCGAATVPPVAPSAIAKPSPVEPTPRSSDPEDVRVRTDDYEWIKRLQALFEKHGIISRICLAESSRNRGGNRYEILVAKEDARRAHELDGELLQEGLDDGTELTEIPPRGTCPYCQTEVDADRTECPHCGLVIAFNNLDIVQLLYQAFADRDREQIRGILDPDVEWIQNEGFPGGGRYVGVETVIKDVLGRLGEDWEGWRAEVGRWLDAGDAIVALGEYHGTNRATGKSMAAAFAHVLWLREGRVVRFEQYADTAKVAAACPAFELRARPEGPAVPPGHRKVSPSPCHTPAGNAPYTFP